MPKLLHGGIIGCGFFAERHIEAWRRIPEVSIVAAADPRQDRAREFAGRTYSSAQEMLDGEQLDFVDIITRADQHLALIRLATDRSVPIICQKPIATDWASALDCVHITEAASVPFMVHENWRWQAWYRIIKTMISQGEIGSPVAYGFRSRTAEGLGYKPYPKQAYFRELSRLLIDEALVHHLDTARFLFGDIETIYAQAGRRNSMVAGEDWAVLTLTHAESVHGWIDGHSFVESNPNGPVAGDTFFEGERGVITLMPTGDIYRDNVLVWRNNVEVGYRGDSVRSTQAHFISCLKNNRPFETSGREYLHTFAAVEAAYLSIAEGRCIRLSEYLIPPIVDNPMLRRVAKARSTDELQVNNKRVESQEN